jgi:hypothetical protein
MPAHSPEQDTKTATPPPISEGTGNAEVISYMVQLTELKWNVKFDPLPKGPDLVQGLEELRKSGRVEIVETIRLSAISDHESTMQFGKTVSVIAGVAQTPQGKMRNLKQIQVGTLLRLTATPNQGKVLLKRQYESSQLGNALEEDISPDIVTSQFKTTLLLEIGVPSLVGGASGDSTTMYLVSVTR